MKSRLETFSITDMASMELGEITLEDCVCQKVRLVAGESMLERAQGGDMRLISLSKWSMAIAAAVLTLGTTLAHHSTAEFDYSKEMTIKGVVKEIQWTNPHSYIQVLVDGPSGETVQWSVEIGSPTLNVNLGWRKDSVKVGDVVTMNLAPTRNGKPHGTLRVLTFADGRQLKGVAAQVRGPAPASAPPAGKQ